MGKHSDGTGVHIVDGKRGSIQSAQVFISSIRRKRGEKQQALKYLYRDRHTELYGRRARRGDSKITYWTQPFLCKEGRGREANGYLGLCGYTYSGFDSF